MERRIHADNFDQIVSDGGNLTALELVQKYVDTRVGVRVWIKDKSLADLDNLPSPDVLADDIIENLQSALESFENLKEQLK